MNFITIMIKKCKSNGGGGRDSHTLNFSCLLKYSKFMVFLCLGQLDSSTFDNHSYTHTNPTLMFMIIKKESLSLWNVIGSSKVEFKLS